jgi:hypothetical protein
MENNSTPRKVIKLVSPDETFEEFMKRVDRFISSRFGVSVHDLADCQWRDCYDAVGGQSGPRFHEEVIATVREYNEEMADLEE